MSTLEATVSMLQAMPEETREILSNLEESRSQIAAGQELDMKNALDEMGIQYGFV